MFQFVSIRIYKSSVGACGCFICFMGANVLRVKLNSGAGRCKAPPICYRSVMDYGDPICDIQPALAPFQCVSVCFVGLLTHSPQPSRSYYTVLIMSYCHNVICYASQFRVSFTD